MHLRWQKTCAALVTLSLLLFTAAGNCETDDRPDVQACAQTQLKNVEFANLESSGAYMINDSETTYVGPYAAGKFGIGPLYLFPHNWNPEADSRQIFCGRLARFDWFSGLGREQDWNLRILPRDKFVDVFQDTLNYVGDSDSVWSCSPSSGTDGSRHSCDQSSSSPEYVCDPNDPTKPCHNCLEAEATPAGDFFENPWFRRTNGGSGACSADVDKDICVYGPLVSESAHGSRPEIHPLEAVWWKEPGTQHWIFIHVQDDSGRFSKDTNFPGLPHPEPTDWVPWSQSPRIALIRIAFSVRPDSGSSRVSYSVFHEFDTAVNPPENLNTGPDHVLKVDGREIVTIIDRSAPNAYAVEFRDVCKAPDGSVQGFIEIQSSVGTQKGRRTPARNGHQVLHVVKDWKEGDPIPLNSQVIPAGPVALLMPESLHARIENSKPVLFADIASAGSNVQATHPNWRTESYALAIEPTHGIASVSAELQQAGVEELKDVRLSQASTQINEAHPKFNLLSRIHVNEVKYHPAPSILKQLARIAGGAPDSLAVLQPVHIDQIQVNAIPQFALQKAGQFDFEEDSPAVNQLNAAIDSDRQDERVALFGRSILTPTWNFRAFDCGTTATFDCSNAREIQPVYVPPPQGSRNRVFIVRNSTPSNAAHATVFFPTFQDDRVFKVTATAVTRDPYDGSTHNVELDFFNVALELPGADPENMDKALRTVAALAGIDSTLLSPTPPDRNLIAPEVQDSKFREAKMINLFISQAADNGLLDAGQLQVLIKAAKKLAGS